MVDLGPRAPFPDDWEPPEPVPTGAAFLERYDTPALRGEQTHPRLLAPDVAASRAAHDTYDAKMRRAVIDAVIITFVGLMLGLLGLTFWGAAGVLVLLLGAMAYGVGLIWWTSHRYRSRSG